MKNYYVFGELLSRTEVIDAQAAAVLVYVARHQRISRVHRHGRRGQRGWVLEPRNKAEQLKRKSRLK